VLEEGASALSKEESGQLAQRQHKFIQSLEMALVRIENKTYGVCRETGKMIPKERLRLVPHATLSVEAKTKENKAYMGKGTLSRGKILALIISAVLILDQISKIWIKTHFTLGQSVHVLGSWFQLCFVENEGMAFGMAFAVMEGS